MSDTYIIHTDGGARGNPGPAAVGVVIEKNSVVLMEFGKQIGESTNNVAEYTAVIEALEKILEKNIGRAGDTFSFLLDSTLVVNQLNGLFKIKNSDLRNLAVKAMVLQRQVRGQVTYAYVPRTKNVRADRLVNQALDQ